MKDGNGFIDFGGVRQALDKHLAMPVLADPNAIPDDWGQDEEAEAAFAALGNLPVN